MSTTIQTLKGEILTIRMTRKNLDRMEAEKHVQLEKALIKADNVSHNLQKVRAEIAKEHPLLQLPFGYWNK